MQPKFFTIKISDVKISWDFKKAVRNFKGPLKINHSIWLHWRTKDKGQCTEKTHSLEPQKWVCCCGLKWWQYTVFWHSALWLLSGSETRNEAVRQQDSTNFKFWWFLSDYLKDFYLFDAIFDVLMLDGLILSCLSHKGFLGLLMQCFGQHTPCLEQSHLNSTVLLMLYCGIVKLHTTHLV